MESGLVRQRKTHLFERYTASIKWELTAEEYGVFTEFLEREAGGGIAWFEAPLYTVDTLTPHKIRLVNGVFQSSYQSWGGWVVTATADIEKIIFSNKEHYLLLKEIPLEDLVALFNPLEKLVNEDLPEAFKNQDYYWLIKDLPVYELVPLLNDLEKLVNRDLPEAVKNLV